MNEEIGLKLESDDELEQVSGGARVGTSIVCPYCHKKIRNDAYLFHVRVCRSNPNHVTLKEIIEEEKAKGQ